MTGALLDLLLAVLLLYFVPFFVGRLRGVRLLGSLFWDNLLYGWTVIGWFFVLYWALTRETEEDFERRYPDI